MAARNTGVTKVIAADVHDERLELARQFGATHTINSGYSVSDPSRISPGYVLSAAIDAGIAQGPARSAAAAAGTIPTNRQGGRRTWTT
jgi:threonine dehydrogenase-like Zn-dependent dehydrogenase